MIRQDVPTHHLPYLVQERKVLVLCSDGSAGEKWFEVVRCFRLEDGYAVTLVVRDDADVRYSFWLHGVTVPCLVGTDPMPV